MLPRLRPPDVAPAAEPTAPAEPAVEWAKGTEPAAPRIAPVPVTVAEVYDRHASFVFRVLRGLGVRDDRVDDAVQDVFIVVHRRLAEFEARSSLTTWLYAIARRVASQYRRSAATRREDEGADLDRLPAHASPFDDAQRNQAARLCAEILDELDDDKREVFVLIELEQMSAPDVAQVLGIPVNTVYSRLRLARARFEASLAKRMAKEAMP
jgi:RNA polymerase sigma-70 factor (ECF subfamily)